MADATMDMVLQLKTEFAAAKKDIAGLRSELDALGKKTNSSGKFLGAFKSQLGSVIGPMAAAGAAAAVLGKGLQATLAKEDALADFSAITGVTGEKLKEFGDIATELSNKFGTSVISNIDSFKQILSRLGPDIAQSKEAVKIMGENVNILAKASGLDATQAMDALTTAMLQFGVDLSNPVTASIEMTDMMNVMAAAAKEGAAEVPALSQALAQVGSTAKSLGISFEETVASIETLALGGKQGAEAGIGLRNVMTSLVKVSKKGEEGLKKIGMTSDDLGRSLTEDGVNEAMKNLGKHLEDLNDPAEAAAIKVQIFGKENLAAATALMNNTDATDKYLDRITDTNAAVDAANIKMATLSEQGKRAAEGGLNALVETFEYMGEIGSEAFAMISNTLNQTADSIGKLLSFDLSGFWDTATMSAGEYANERERASIAAEKEFQALLAQERLRAKETQQRAAIAALQKNINDQLVKTGASADERVKHIDAIKEAYMKGSIARVQFDEDGGVMWATVNAAIDEYWLMLKRVNESTTSTSEAAKVVKNTKVIVDTWEELAEKERQAASVATELFLTLNGGTRSLQDNMQKLVDQNPIGEAFVGPDGVLQNMDLGISKADEFALAWEQVGVTIEDIGAVFRTAFSGSDDAMKSALKMLLNTAIDFLEAELIIGETYATVKALLTSGLSAITDAPLLVAAYAGLEVARGFVNSFRTGINFVPNDQIAMLHQGEKVQSASEVNSERPHERRRYMREPVHWTQFKTVVDSYYANQGRRVR